MVMKIARSYDNNIQKISKMLPQAELFAVGPSRKGKK